MLSHVDPVRIGLESHFYIVIDDERDFIFPAQLLNGFRLQEKFAVTEVLLPQLQKSSSAFQRKLHLLIQGPVPQPAAVRDGI